MNNQNEKLPFHPGMNRRRFISETGKATGAALMLSLPLVGFSADGYPGKDVTVGDIMDAFISEVPGAPFPNTVDTLKAGSRDIKVTGIVTTMFATLEIINKAIAAKANFIIAHEPTYYNHLDSTDWLENDDVYTYKKELLQKHNIAVWRNHDYVHRHNPDGVYAGVVEKMGWSKNYSAANNVVSLPGISLRQLIARAKQQLGIGTVRYMGDLSHNCRRILLMPGAAGGRRQIENMSREKPDALVCGEIQEWETAEYVRDAQTKGQQLSLVVLGHIVSEEPGSAYMAEWLRKKTPAIPVSHVPTGPSLLFL